ncbi:MAG: hypothetical protein LIO91_03780 [Bacteroidales bacterium]|nr:hypothetical protein [Bacteroidales bacterium]
MKTIATYINGDTTNSYVRYGIRLAETSLTALMTPPPLKDYISNSSALEHGKRVLTDNGNRPKVNEREVQLVISLEASSLAQFLTRYRAFCDVLKQGVVSITLVVTENATRYSETFHLNFLSCSQYSEFNGRLGKFTLKFNEPNPENRELVTTSDITQ